ncbi:MAG: PKD domain-containing protein [Halobacteria archaeon]
MKRGKSTRKGSAYRKYVRRIAVASVVLAMLTWGAAGVAAADEHSTGATPPDCILSNTNVNVGEDITVDASGAGAIGDVEVRMKDGGAWVNLGGEKGTISYSNSGTYTPEIRYKTRLGQQDWQTSKCKPSSVTVHESIEYTADFSYSPKMPDTGTMVTFNSEAKPADKVNKIQWSFGDQPTVSPDYGQQTEHRFEKSGNFKVSMMAKFTNGETRRASKFVFVQSAEPSASFEVLPSNPEKGQSVTFKSTSTGPGGLASQNWKIDGNSVHEGAQFSHTFDQSGSHTVELSVKTKKGGTDTVTKTVSVSGGGGGGGGGNDSGGDQGQPGFGIVAVLAAFSAVAAVGLRRRS